MTESQLLVAFPYPWTQAIARELHEEMLRICNDSTLAIEIAEKHAGIKSWDVNASQTTYFVWRDLLEAAARGGSTTALVENTRRLTAVTL